MKANELMVGDWMRVNRDGLCIKNGAIVKVLGVDGESKLKEKGLIGYAGCQPLDKEQFSGGIWLDYLDPIPLTPEILEKNGFVRVERGEICTCYRWREKSDKIYGRLVDIHLYKEPIQGVFTLIEIETCSNKGDGLNRLHSCDTDYVHDLQHALRLCGIEKEIVL